MASGEEEDPVLRYYIVKKHSRLDGPSIINVPMSNLWIVKSGKRSIDAVAHGAPTTPAVKG